MSELKNEFTWSTKRGNVFEECRRRYWFEYYGGWGGWSPRADDRTRSIYVLKQLKGRQAWAGEHVHQAVADALHLIHAGLPADPEELAGEVVRRMRAQFRESRDREYWSRPKKACGLVEHEFDIPVSDAEWGALADHARACLMNFFASPVLAELRALDRANWLQVEEMERFQLEGVPVWVKMDLAYRAADGRLRIVDWKTGKLDPHPDPIQLTCYAIYASEKWKVEPERIETAVVNLGANESIVRQVDAALIATVRGRIRVSIEGMTKMLEGPREENAPLPESAFAVTDSTGVCRRCPFRKVCPDSPLHRL
jgi:hypothetical protein